MFMISWFVALLTLFVCWGLYAYVGHLKPDVSWGDVGQALTYQRSVRLLMSLGRSQQDHIKNYRISYCVMAGVPGRRPDLVLFFDQLRRGGGLMVAGNVIRGERRLPRYFITALFLFFLPPFLLTRFLFRP
jgi:hypothetical protein